VHLEECLFTVICTGILKPWCVILASFPTPLKAFTLENILEQLKLKKVIACSSSFMYVFFFLYFFSSQNYMKKNTQMQFAIRVERDIISSEIGMYQLEQIYCKTLTLFYREIYVYASSTNLIPNPLAILTLL
jgi:hypothetical protein